MGWISSALDAEEDVMSDSIAFQTLSREWGHVYKLRVRTRVKEARALDRTLALSYSSDSSKVTQTTGSYYFEHYTRKVERRKANPADGWTVTITETWSALYQDATWMNGCAETYFTSDNPTEPT